MWSILRNNMRYLYWNVYLFNVKNILALNFFIIILVTILLLLNPTDVIVAMVPFTTPFEIFIFFASITIAPIVTYLIWLDFGSCNLVFTFSMSKVLVFIITSKNVIWRKNLMHQISHYIYWHFLDVNVNNCAIINITNPFMKHNNLTILE